jgi:predicted RNase H-like HicB family nuclease
MTSERKSDSEIVFEVEQAAEGGFVAQAVGQSIFTQGASIEQIREAVREAVACHFDAGAVPSVIRLRIVLEEVLRP